MILTCNLFIYVFYLFPYHLLRIDFDIDGICNLFLTISIHIARKIKFLTSYLSFSLWYIVNGFVMTKNILKAFGVKLRTSWSIFTVKGVFAILSGENGTNFSRAWIIYNIHVLYKHHNFITTISFQ